MCSNCRPPLMNSAAAVTNRVIAPETTGLFPQLSDYLETSKELKDGETGTGDTRCARALLGGCHHAKVRQHRPRRGLRNRSPLHRASMPRVYCVTSLSNDAAARDRPGRTPGRQAADPDGGHAVADAGVPGRALHSFSCPLNSNSMSGLVSMRYRCILCWCRVDAF